MTEIKNVTNETWDEEVDQSEGLVIAQFWAEWCGPCRNMKPIVERLADDLQKKRAVKVDDLPIRFVKINIDENQDLASQNDVTSIPNLIFFHNGKRVHSTIGSMSYGGLKDTVKSIAKKL